MHHPTDVIGGLIGAAFGVLLVAGGQALVARLLTTLARNGYLAVLILVEDFGVPAPGETVLVVASIDAHDSRLNIVAVAVLALVAAIVGNTSGASGPRNARTRPGRVRAHRSEPEPVIHVLDWSL